MDEAGESFFADAAFSCDQNGGIDLRDARRAVEHIAHRGALDVQRGLVIARRRGRTCSFHLSNRDVMRDQKMSKENATRMRRRPSDPERINSVDSNQHRDDVIGADNGAEITPSLSEADSTHAAQRRGAVIAPNSDRTDAP